MKADQRVAPSQGFVPAARLGTEGAAGQGVTGPGYQTPSRVMVAVLRAYNLARA